MCLLLHHDILLAWFAGAHSTCCGPWGKSMPLYTPHSLCTPCEHGEALPLLLQSFQAIRCAGISVPFGSTDQHVAASGPTLPCTSPCTLSTSPVLMVQRGTWGFARCNLCPDLNITVPCWDCRRFKGKFLLLCFWTVFEFHSKNDPVLLRVITALNSRPLTVTRIPCCWHQW